MEVKLELLLTNSIRHIHRFNRRLNGGISRLNESPSSNSNENLVPIYLSGRSIDFNAGCSVLLAIYLIIIMTDLHIRTDPISARALPTAYHGI